MTHEGEQQVYPKTHAKELYCLGEKDLEPLPVREKRNPYVRKGAPMKLYRQSDLESVAIEKWGSLASVEEEKQKRVAKKEKGALERARSVDKGDDGEVALSGGDTASCDQRQHSSSPVHERGKLHPLVGERIQKLKARTSASAEGSFVLYWMRTAVRDHDNPALDVAMAEAAARELPLLCVSFILGKTHTYPTHRRFKFLLEGIRDVQSSFKAKVFLAPALPGMRLRGGARKVLHGCCVNKRLLRTRMRVSVGGIEHDTVQGIPYMLYIEGVSEHSSASIASGWDALVLAASKANLVVTEIMPTPPYAQNLQDLSAAMPEPVEVWAVDTACIVPVTLTKQPYAKAFAYRASTAKLREERLSRLPYSGIPVEGVTSDSSAAVYGSAVMPWTSVDLAEAPDLLGVLRRSEAFDSSVPGVDHMIGGQIAGYARWETFRRSGLSQYAARRNNPMLRSGVSRMSAYHHFGMVSPFQIARQATAASNPGARKFADEFMTWRELSYCFCFHKWRILETLEVLPTWVRKTLAAHNEDARDLKTLDALEQGCTGDKIWDALQHQLNVTGELHNNVRMTWGKALLRWTPDPETALKQTCHLNHKYALDGCDPSSYGGILWCFGQFDGPKGSNDTPVIGSLRDRPTHWLTRKIDPVRFRELPLDATAAQLVATAAQSRPTANIISSARASHSQVATPGGKVADSEGQERSAKAVSSVGKMGISAQSAAKRKQEKDQPRIEQFFKKTKG